MVRPLFASMPTSSTPLAAPLESHVRATAPAPIDEFAHRMLLAGGDHEILRLGLLQHQPLRSHVVARMAPVAQRVEIAEIQAVLQPHR